MSGNIKRRDFIRITTGSVTAGIFLPTMYVRRLPVATKPVTVAYQDQRGRVFSADSLTYLDEVQQYGLSPVTKNDVVIGGSFAGIPTFAEVLKLGARGVIAHEAGVGKAQAGIQGLYASEKYGIPAAAVATQSARISDGRSVAQGSISYVNASAQALGIQPGMKAIDAAVSMLDAPPGTIADLSPLIDETMHVVKEEGNTRVIAVWSIGLVEEDFPNDIFCVASHAGRAMADYALPVNPRAIFANDAGLAKDRSGVEGLRLLDKHGIPAAAVGADSAKIGDALSTYAEGVCSVVNRKAKALGMQVGMTVRQAIDLLLQ